jgi:hypothetical protein
MERRFVQFASRTRLSLAFIGAVTIAARAALLPWLPVPEPKIHDEFSYLLAANTFVHGRLTNPPHPLAIFLDTFHVIQYPTYASMYPPAQGMVLAIGELLGHPWVGVLLSAAAMCVAFTWMLQGWVPAEWALLGGALVVSRFALFSYWMNSYWGGAVAATGAALVTGALPRIWERRRPRDAVIFGLGAGILATSRPVEGLIFCIPLGVALLWRALRQESSVRRIYAKRVIAPVAAILIGVIGFMAYYNWRVTRSPVVFPHEIEQRQYVTTALFLWQHDKPPINYANPQFDDFFHNFMPSLYEPGWAAAKDQFQWKSAAFWRFFLGPALSIPFLALPWLWKYPRNRLLLAQFALCALGLWVVVYYHAHYAAPVMAVVIALMMQGMRVLRGWQIRGRPVGVAATRLITIFCLLIGPVYFVHSLLSDSHPALDWFHRHGMLVLALAAVALALPRLGSYLLSQSPAFRPWLISSCELLLLAGIVLQAAVMQSNLHPLDYPFVDDLAEPFRKPVEQQLEALPGQHLVLVQYSQDHDSGEEYVYNDADIDDAKIVWAREIPGMDLGPLLRYFRNRDVWIYAPDDDDESLSPYVRKVPPGGPRVQTVGHKM